MTRTTPTKTTSALTPRLAELRSAFMGGAGVSLQDVMNAHARDLRDEWEDERDAERAAAVAADRAQWSPELAEFLAASLANDGGGTFPRATVFTTQAKDVPAGNPAVIITPASNVEHAGNGMASGKVTFNFLNLAKPDVKQLAAMLAPYSHHKVEVGNVLDWKPVDGVARSTGWVLDLPYIAHPSAAGLAHEVKRELEGMPVRAVAGGTEVDRGVAVDVTIGQSHILSNDGETVVLKGHVVARSSGTDQVGQSIAYTDAEMIEAAKRIVQRIADRGGFLPGGGKVQDAEVVETMPVVRNGELKSTRPGLGIAFTVTARGRYDV